LLRADVAGQVREPVSRASRIGTRQLFWESPNWQMRESKKVQEVSSHFVEVVACTAPERPVVNPGSRNVDPLAYGQMQQPRQVLKRKLAT